MGSLKVGDPMDEATEIGPLATEQILDGVHAQVQKTVAAGLAIERPVVRRNSCRIVFPVSTSQIRTDLSRLTVTIVFDRLSVRTS